MLNFTLSKLGYFIWEQFGISSPCPANLTLPWQPLIDKRFFRILNFPPCSWKIITFWKKILHIKIIFMLMYWFLSLLDQFWRCLKVLKNQETKMATVWKHDVFLTLYQIISWCCGPLRKRLLTYYLFFTLLVIALIFSEIFHSSPAR